MPRYNIDIISLRTVWLSQKTVNVYYTLYDEQSTLYRVQCALYRVHTVHCNSSRNGEDSTISKPSLSSKIDFDFDNIFNILRIYSQ